MTLAAYKPKTRDIPVDDALTIKVRALSLTDVSVLVEVHLKDLDVFFEEFARANENVFATETGANMFTMLLKDAPHIAAHIITLAADEDTEEARAGALRLPMPAMLEALIGIGEMTFTDYGGPKKFFETMLQIWGSMTASTSSPALALKPNRKARRLNGST